MGGRGGSSGMPSGRKMTIAGFLKNFRSANERDLEHLGMDIQKAKFTENGNSVKLQTATIQSGSDRIEAAFYSSYNPLQQSNADRNIESSITVRHWKDGNIQAYRQLVSKKTKSVRNAKKNYDEVLNTWKKITKQKTILF